MGLRGDPAPGRPSGIGDFAGGVRPVGQEQARASEGQFIDLIDLIKDLVLPPLPKKNPPRVDRRDLESIFDPIMRILVKLPSIVSSPPKIPNILNRQPVRMGPLFCCD